MNPKHEKDRPSVGADKPVKPQNNFAENVEDTLHSIADLPQIPQRSIDPEVFEQELHGCYIAVVQVNSRSPEPRYRRQLYMSLKPAQRRIDKAREDGRDAFLILAQLHVIPNGAQHLIRDGEAA
jgi:hypothetical protein